jgi:hypothetical protein
LAAAFHGGLETFKAYLVGLSGKEGEFSSTRLIEVMASFSEPLYTHLKEELDAIVNLSRFSTPEKPIDIVAIALKVGKQAVTLDFALNCLPASCSTWRRSSSKAACGTCFRRSTPPSGSSS